MMLSCSFLALFLTCHAAPQSGACPPSLESLRRLLQMPAEARLVIESRFEYAARSEKVLEQSLAYRRAVPRDRWIADSRADKEWVRGQLERIKIDRPDRIPIALNSWLIDVRQHPGGRQFSRSEICTFKWPDFRWEALELFQDGEPLKRYRLRRNGELTAWSTISGERQRTDRMQGTSDDFGLDGTLVRYYQLLHDISTLLAIAEEQGEIGLQGAELLFCADMRKPTDLKRLDFGPIGFYEMPGVVICKAKFDSQELALEVQWHDSLGGLFSRYDVTWRTEGATFPRELEQLYFAPGTDVVTTRFAMSSEELPWEPSAEPFTWHPVPGERVVDSRFGSTVSYRVSETGTIPEDASILVEAERERATFHSDRIPVYSAQDQAGPASSPDGEDPPAGRALRAVSDTLDLGRQPVASSHRLVFTLRNETDATVTIGSIRPDCGCTEVLPDLPNPYRHLIRAGETRAMTFQQEVQSVGPQDHLIRINVVEPWEEVVELHVRFEGTPALKLFPDPLDLGRVSVDQPIRATAYLVDSGCVPEGESPICEASGFSVSSAWSRSTEGDFMVGELTLAPRAGRNRLGVQQTFLNVRASGCPDALGQSLLRVELVPEGELERWPSCTIILSRGHARETGSLALPDTEMTGFTTTPSELPTGVLCRIEGREGSDRLEVSVEREVLRLRETYSFTVHLATSSGTVDVPVYVLPATPAENGMQFRK